MKIELACEKEGDGGEVFFAVASGLALGGLNDGVEAFEDAVVDL